MTSTQSKDCVEKPDYIALIKSVVELNIERENLKLKIEELQRKVEALSHVEKEYGPYEYNGKKFHIIRNVFSHCQSDEERDSLRLTEEKVGDWVKGNILKQMEQYILVSISRDHEQRATIAMGTLLLAKEYSSETTHV
jgi:hypothetical protein